jgi:GH25 family lysozyme M1 (1,4-beta-N-acetylmuramidase)
VYTYPAFAEQGNCARLGRWPLWIAHWGVARPVVPAPWKTWRLWQYASGQPDLDVFNGTADQARRFFLLD